MKKRLAVLIFTVMLLSAVFTFSAAAEYDPGYKINSYHINVDVGPDNILDVTEIINVYFVPGYGSHGIYRYLDTVTDVTRQIEGRDVTKTHRIIISDIRAEDITGSSDPMSGAGTDVLYDVSSSWKKLDIQMGDADRVVDGRTVTYRLSYKYDIGDDGISQFDDFYYNLIGSMTADSNNITFSIDFPKPIQEDPSLISFTHGSYGSTDSNVSYSVSPDRMNISGRLDRLGYGEYLTLRAELPEGYFEGERIDSNISYWFLAVLAIALAATAVLLWYAFGRDRLLYKVVGFSAPEGLTPAEVGYITESMADDNDMLSLIIYWADKGYLSIDAGSTGGFSLRRLKQPGPEFKQFERTMFNGLFSGSDTATEESLKYKFHDKLTRAKLELAREFKGEKKLYSASSVAARFFCSLLAGACISVMTAYSVYCESFSAGFGIITFLISTAIAAVICGIGYTVADKTIAVGKKPTGAVIGLGVFFAAVSVVFCVLFSGNIILAAICTAGALVAAAAGVFAHKRTSWSNKIFGEILGFRDFLIAAEKDRLEALVNDDPEYFYHILPYAYALGVSDKWAKQFESIAVAPPSYTTGYNPSTFGTMMYLRYLNANMARYRSSMTAVEPPKSSSGGSGGFGGRGFSGGGFGGGGGGRW